MTTIGEMIQRVQSIYSRGVQTKDSRLTPRHIYSALIGVRATLLQQKANKNQYITSWNYQTLPCVELIDAPLHECPCAPNGQVFLRSKNKLPKPVVALDKPLISQVSSLDNTIRFDLKEFDTFRYSKGRKFTSTKAVSFYRNEYLYLAWVKKVKAVPVVGIFHDVIEAHQYPTICGDCIECECQTPFDMEFPLDGELIQPAIEMANQELIILFKQNSADSTNDASDNDDLRSEMIHQGGDQQR